MQTPETPTILGVLSAQSLGSPHRSDPKGGDGLEALQYGRSQGEPIIDPGALLDARDDDVLSPEEGTTSDPLAGREDHTGDLPTEVDALSPDIDFTPMESTNQVGPSNGPAFPFPVTSSPTTDPLPPRMLELGRSRSSFKKAVREKLERSRSSLRALKIGNNGVPDDSPATSSSTGAAVPNEPRPKAARLRSLLSQSISRSGSSTSVGSTASFSSTTTSTSAHLDEASLNDNSSRQARSNSAIASESSAAVRHSARSLHSRLQDTQFRHIRSDAAIAGESAAAVPHWARSTQSRLQDNQFRHLNSNAAMSGESSAAMRHLAQPLPAEVRSTGLPEDLEGFIKGKAAQHPRSPFLMPLEMPRVFSSSSSGPPRGYLLRPPPITAPSGTDRIALPRAISSPLPNALESSASNSHDVRPPKKPTVNLFDTILPRELRVMIFRTLLEMPVSVSSNRKWEGETGGRRQLIRFTRVSHRDHLWN